MEFKTAAYSEEARSRAYKRWDSIAKPLKGMGMFEDTIAQIEGMPAAHIGNKRCVLVFCADNGVVEEGVTQTGSEVTAAVAGNMASGNATVCKMAKVAGADVFPVDIGMLRPVEGVRDVHVLRGTGNFYRTRAMSREDCEKAIMTGASLVKELHAKGYSMIATGEMGIGNTTTASAVACALLGAEPRYLTGKGAGLSDAGLRRKIEVIEQSLARLNPDSGDAVDVLSKVGGLDIAGMCGAFIGGAEAGIPVLIDGVISAVAALCAANICPASKDYMIASHMSASPRQNSCSKNWAYARPSARIWRSAKARARSRSCRFWIWRMPSTAVCSPFPTRASRSTSRCDRAVYGRERQRQV